MFVDLDEAMAGASDAVWEAAKEMVGHEYLEAVFVLLRDGFLLPDDDQWKLERPRQLVEELAK